MIQGGGDAHERMGILWAVIVLGGAMIAVRLAQMQILDSAEWRYAAERNRTQIIYQTAPRGRIYDRNGLALASNQPAFSLIFMPGKKGEKRDLKPLSQALARELKKDPDGLLETLQEAGRAESALRLAENLPPKAMFRLSELKTVYPGIDLIVEARRYYPFGPVASHLLGYMGRMDPKSWRTLRSKGYRADSRVGRMGLERIFEEELRGTDGGIRMEVDAQGRLKRVLERIEWQPGNNVHLTIDTAVQKAADEGLRKSPTNKGAVVALDPRTGAILAIASAPAFDPNHILSSDPDLVKKAFAEIYEFNHATSGAYPPGSTFKAISGAAILNEGKATTEETVFCPGYFELGSRVVLCWEHKGHKKVSWLEAFAKSCDVYFYKMGLKTGGALIEKYEKLFGLGQETKIVLKPESRGWVFGPQGRASQKRGWYDGDTINLAIGQGELLVTPLQMANAAAAMANRGVLWRPHFTDRIVYSNRPEYKHKPEKLSEFRLKEETWANLDKAMALVVSSGTGVAARIPGLLVAGKTGTAQNPHGDDHAWFIAYARLPDEAESRVAVAVLVENGGHGSSVAAPIAKQVMMAAYGLTDKPVPPPAPKLPPLPMITPPPAEAL